MPDFVLQWMRMSRGLRTLLIHGGVGCGKSAILQRIADFFNDIPVLRLPAHLNKQALTPALLQRARQSLVLIDDVHRMDDVVLTLLLNNQEWSEFKSYLVVSCLSEEPLSASLRDRFAISWDVNGSLSASSDSGGISASLPALGEWPEEICSYCQKEGYQGHRAEIAWMRAAQVCACLQNEKISAEHVEAARIMTLSHRDCQKHAPVDLPDRKVIASSSGINRSSGASGMQQRPMPPLRRWNKEIQVALLVNNLLVDLPDGKRRLRQPVRKRNEYKSYSPSVGYRRSDCSEDIHIVATLQHALLWQNLRRSGNQRKLRIFQDDWHCHVRKFCQHASYVLVVDASASMHAEKRIALAKAIYQEIIRFAYPRKESVALLVFRNQQLQVLSPSGSWWLKIHQQLDSLACSGRSPLDRMFSQSLDYARKWRLQGHPEKCNWFFLSDFHPNGAENIEGISPVHSMFSAAGAFCQLGHSTTIIDAEDGFVRLGLGKQVAACMGARYFSCQQFIS